MTCSERKIWSKKSQNIMTMIVDGSPSKPQLVGDKELEILIMTNIATLKRKRKKY